MITHINGWYIFITIDPQQLRGARSSSVATSSPAADRHHRVAVA